MSFQQSNQLNSQLSPLPLIGGKASRRESDFDKKSLKASFQKMLKQSGKPNIRLINDIKKQKQHLTSAQWFTRMRIKQNILLFIANMKKNAYIYKFTGNLLQEKYLEDGQLAKSKNKQSLDPIIIRVFQPDDLVIIIFDILSIIITFFTLWFYPFYRSFYRLEEQQFNTLIWVQMGLLLFIFLDMILCCNTAAIKQGEIVQNRLEIARHYFQEQGLYDFLLLSTWIIQLVQGNFILDSIFSLVIILLIIKRVHSKVVCLQESTSFRGAIQELIDLVLLIIIIYFFAHITGCIWHFVGQHSEGYNWLNKYNYQDTSVGVRYNQSFYWATMTMTTIGYGDITAANSIETAYSSLIMVLSSCIFAYSMNQIGIIIKNMNDSTSNYKRSLFIINSYMKKHQVNLKLQSRVRNYLKYYLDQSNNNMQETDKVIDTLPSGLKHDLNEDVKLRILNSTPLIAKNFSSETILKMAQYLNFTQYTPQEVILRQEILTEPYLYFVIDGVVSISEKHSNFRFYDSIKGQTFNQYQFITGFKPDQMAVSQTFSNICTLSREHFIILLKQKPSDYEKFCQIKDEVLFEQNLQKIKLQCKQCQSENHLQQQCPLLQYKPSLEIIIKRWNFTQNQRQRCNRLNNRRINARDQMKSIVYFTEAFFKQEEEYESYQNLQLPVSEIQTSVHLDDNSNIQSWRENSSPRICKIPIMETKSALQGLLQTQMQIQSSSQLISSSNNNINNLTSKIVISQPDNLDSMRKLGESTNKIRHQEQKKLFDHRGTRAKLTFEKGTSRQTYVINSRMDRSQTQINDPVSQTKIRILEESFDIDRVYNFKFYLTRFNISVILEQKYKKPPIYLYKLIKQASQYLFYYNYQYFAANRNFEINV